jgi:Tfp pilus assembly protein PilF
LRILNGIRIAWRYIGLQAYPGALSCDYSYNAIPLYAYWSLAAIPLVATLVVLAIWVWALRSRRNGWFLAGAIYFGSFAVTANILLPTGTIMAERLAYLPSAGFCLLLALIWVQLETRRAEVAWILLGIIVAALSARTMVRNLDWKNNFALFSSAVRVVPESARVHRNLGDEYVRRGELEAAFVEFRTALRIFPDYPDVLENYGLAEARAGHAQEARKLLETAVSMTPGGSPDRAYVQTNLAWQLLRMGETENALKVLNEVIASSPDYSRAWSERAITRYKRGEAAAARSDLEMALRLDPRNEQALALISLLGPASSQSNTR